MVSSASEKPVLQSESAAGVLDLEKIEIIQRVAIERGHDIVAISRLDLGSLIAEVKRLRSSLATQSVGATL